MRQDLIYRICSRFKYRKINKKERTLVNSGPVIVTRKPSRP